MASKNLESAWQHPLQPLNCEVCDWSYLTDLVDESPIVCPHCYRASLTELDEEELLQAGGPELVVPFQIAREQVQTALGEFARSYWLPPPDLKSGKLLARLRRVYVPVWLVDSDVSATWQAEAGFDYQVVSHQEKFAGGKWITAEVKETKIRWEPRLGHLQRRYENVRAPALEEFEEIRARLGPFDSKSATAYRPAASERALVRLPNRDQTDAWPDTQPRFKQLAMGECQRASRSDHFRQFGWQAEYHNQRWSLLLAPLYSTWYLDDDGRPVPILLNGRSGQFHGLRRASMKRARAYTRNLAILAALLFLVSVALMVWSLSLGLVSLALTALLGLAAIVPVAYASQFNRRQQAAIHGGPFSARKASSQG
jgi:hypothetical protein